MEWLSSVVDYGIIGFLVLLNIVAVAVALERTMFYRGLGSVPINRIPIEAWL